MLDKDKNLLPALYVGSRILWSGIHERGGSISGRMLIPLHGRVGRKRFKAQIAELMRGGNAYFIKNAKGNIVLMAENIKEHDRPLGGFRCRYRKAEGQEIEARGRHSYCSAGATRAAQKRLNVERLVAGRVPRLAAAIENSYDVWIEQWPIASLVLVARRRDEGLKRAVDSAEKSLGELSGSAKTAGQKASAGMAEVNAGSPLLANRSTVPRHNCWPS